MKKVEWKTKDGRQVEVIIERVHENIWTDGHQVEVDAGVKVTARVAGAVVGIGTPRVTNNPAVASAIGKLGISKKNTDSIWAAYHDLNDTTEKKEAEEDYVNHRARMRRVMGY